MPGGLHSTGAPPPGIPSLGLGLGQSGAAASLPIVGARRNCAGADTETPFERRAQGERTAVADTSGDGGQRLVALAQAVGGQREPPVGDERHGWLGHELGEAGPVQRGRRPRLTRGRPRSRGVPGLSGSPTWPARPPGRRGRALAYLASFALTAGYHVSRNNRLDRVDPATDDAAAAWTAYAPGWKAWNHLRTLSAMGSVGALALALAQSG